MPVNVGLKTRILPAGEAAVAAAARCLEGGGLVAFPTETVYGLGADATNAAAIARLYQAKGRPAFNPLIAHVGISAAAMRIARFDARASALAEAFWPGPLTLVLPKTKDCAGGRSRHRRSRDRRDPGAGASPWRRTSCARSAARWWRRRRICRAMCRRPRRRMCKATLPGGST